MKHIKIWFVAFIIVVVLLLAQFVISSQLKLPIYLFYYETFFANRSFRYILDIQNVIVFYVGVTCIIYLLLYRKQFKLISTLGCVFLVGLFSYQTFKMNHIPKQYIHAKENGIVLGKGNPIKMTFYGRFTCKDCVHFNDELSDLIQTYIDNHQLELTVKLTDAKSVMALENIDYVTYRQYAALYQKSSEIKAFDVLSFQNQFGKDEYQKRMAIATNNQKEAKLLKVHWVPTFFIREKKYEGHFTKAAFQKIIEKELKNGKSN